MHPYIIWSPFFSVRVPYVDKQHMNLISIVNDFYESVINNKDSEHIFKTLNGLIKYAEEHFADEEEILSKTDYPDDTLTTHKLLHIKLIEEVFQLNEEYVKGKKQSVYQVELFLNNWLITHILEVDKKYEPFCANQRYFNPRENK